MRYSANHVFLYCADRDAKTFRNFQVTHSFQAAQHEDGASTLWELIQGDQRRLERCSARENAVWSNLGFTHVLRIELDVSVLVTDDATPLTIREHAIRNLESIAAQAVDAIQGTTICKPEENLLDKVGDIVLLSHTLAEVADQRRTQTFQRDASCVIAF